MSGSLLNPCHLLAAKPDPQSNLAIRCSSSSSVKKGWFSHVPSVERPESLHHKAHLNTKGEGAPVLRTNPPTPSLARTPEWAPPPPPATKTSSPGGRRNGNDKHYHFPPHSVGAVGCVGTGCVGGGVIGGSGCGRVAVCNVGDTNPQGRSPPRTGGC